MTEFGSSLTLFLSLLVEAIPFLILGVLVSGLLLLFVDERKLMTLFPQNPILGALAGSLFGFLFPVCECGNVPVARRLLIQGVSAPVAIGFLLAAPTVNPVVVWATWSAFQNQPEIVVLRFIFSLAIAVIVAWVFSFQKDLRPFLQPAIAAAMPSLAPPTDAVSPLLRSGTFLLDQPGQPIELSAANLQAVLTANPTTPTTWRDRWPLFLENTVQELREMGGILVLGSFLATVIQVAVPRDIILNLGQGPVTSIVAMIILGGVVSICSTVDAFFALSFASTFTGGALLAFLVFGPMFDLKSLGLLLTVFKARAVAYIFVLILQLTLVSTLIINLWVS